MKYFIMICNSKKMLYVYQNFKKVIFWQILPLSLCWDTGRIARCDDRLRSDGHQICFMIEHKIWDIFLRFEWSLRFTNSDGFHQMVILIFSDIRWTSCYHTFFWDSIVVQTKLIISDGHHYLIIWRGIFYSWNSSVIT